jgi:hypothetical protein
MYEPMDCIYKYVDKCHGMIDFGEKCMYCPTHNYQKNDVMMISQILQMYAADALLSAHVVRCLGMMYKFICENMPYVNSNPMIKQNIITTTNYYINMLPDDDTRQLFVHCGNVLNGANVKRQREDDCTEDNQLKRFRAENF